jgi:hypothetical protein
MRQKTSIIWKPNREEFQTIVNQYNSLADILRHFGLHVGAGNYKTLKNRLREDSVNFEHIKLGINSNKNRPSPFKLELNEILDRHLVFNSKIKSSKLKEYILKFKLLDNKCSECGQLPEWNGKPLILQLDHINGNSSDNRLENLRILCPHCHSQTDTFSGKRLKKHYNCIDCHCSITKNSTRCKSCSSKLTNRKTKINWPQKEELIKITNDIGFSAAGRELGVSDNAIRKRLKIH